MSYGPWEAVSHWCFVIVIVGNVVFSLGCCSSGSGSVSYLTLLWRLWTRGTERRGRNLGEIKNLREGIDEPRSGVKMEKMRRTGEDRRAVSDGRRNKRMGAMLWYSLGACWKQACTSPSASLAVIGWWNPSCCKWNLIKKNFHTGELWNFIIRLGVCAHEYACVPLCVDVWMNVYIEKWYNLTRKSIKICKVAVTFQLQG